jgi:hypothetical protein
LVAFIIMRIAAQVRDHSASAGSEHTQTDPSSGETQRSSHGKNKSAAEDRSPAAQKDRRIRPE